MVCSSNNGAVENISKELPIIEKLDAYKTEMSYFKECANSPEEWGLFSAVLGNQKNISNFKNHFFDASETKQSIKAVLKDKDSNWLIVRANFKKKLNELVSEKERINFIREQYSKFNSIVIEIQNSVDKLLELNETKKSLMLQLENSKNEDNRIFSEINKLTAEIEQIKESKPSWYHSLFNTKVLKRYNSDIKRISNYLLQSEQSKENSTKIRLEIEKLLDKTKSSLLKCEYQNTVLNEELIQLTAALKTSKLELNQDFADHEYWKSIDTKEIQESCPWYSKKLKQLQSELFIESLKVNESFLIEANKKSNRIVSSLEAFFIYLQGKNTSILSKDEIQALWDVFFLVIPVMSSTFASIQTMFKDLESNAIPWLFIDEAGQTIPQAAVGAIWRSKRVVVVGDPFQIEPVVTISPTLVNNISEFFNLTVDTIHADYSAQTYADRVNKFGAYINGKWIGSPLKVHRRCLNPMFEIANKIAYENSMFLSTLSRKTNVNFETKFIDVKGHINGKHFVLEQAEVVLEIINSEIKLTGGLPNIFIISPFGEVCSKLKTFLQNKICFTNEDVSIWLKSSVGTVHSFQGKEADGVILCLGLDSSKLAAASWASSKPNLLNVALTRAKYRFIAVGDKDIWIKQKYFSELIKL